MMLFKAGVDGRNDGRQAKGDYKIKEKTILYYVVIVNLTIKTEADLSMSQ